MLVVVILTFRELLQTSALISIFHFARDTKANGPPADRFRAGAEELPETSNVRWVVDNTGIFPGMEL